MRLPWPSCVRLSPRLLPVSSPPPARSFPAWVLSSPRLLSISLAIVRHREFPQILLFQFTRKVAAMVTREVGWKSQSSEDQQAKNFAPDAVCSISASNSASPTLHLRPPTRFHLSCPGAAYLGIPEGLRATRKPRPLPRPVGVSPRRFADRQCAASARQLPPRYTRSEPSRGPTGSATTPFG